MFVKVVYEIIVFQICPVCAASPHGDPNMVTEDLASHLQSAHCSQQDDANRPLRSKIFNY